MLFHVDTIIASHNWNDNGFVCNSGGNTFTFTTLTNNGDSTLLKIRGKINRNILIDAGNYGANVGAILKMKGISKLDTVIITHNDPDHINGIYKFKEYGLTINNLYFAYPFSKVNIATTNITALDMVKTLHNQGVITNKATRIMDEEYHSGVENNMNMDASDTYYLRICRGRLFKLYKMENEGFDLTIFPPITDSSSGSWGINNDSMMIVFENDNNKVVFGADLQATALQDINRLYDKSEKTDRISEKLDDSYSYSYGIKNILFANKKKYTVYKVSHHGTGSNRKLPCSILSSCLADKDFISYLDPDVLIMTGHGNDSQINDSNYFRYYSSVPRYRDFSLTPLLN